MTITPKLLSEQSTVEEMIKSYISLTFQTNPVLQFHLQGSKATNMV